MIYIGVDPGKNGGFAVLNSYGCLIDTQRMPSTPLDIYNYLSEIAHNYSEILCVLEDVGYGRPGQSSIATATFARHNGHLEMALLVLGLPTVTVTPQKWMRYYQLGTMSECKNKTVWKNKLKAKAQLLFPKNAKDITLNTSDAVLLANYILNIKKH